MAKEQPKKNTDPKKPKFSAYWIYAAIILTFLGIQMFTGTGFNDPSTTTPSQFITFLEQGDVEKVVIVNRAQGKIYLTPEAKEKEEHQSTSQDELFPSPDTPDYTFEFGDL